MEMYQNITFSQIPRYVYIEGGRDGDKREEGKREMGRQEERNIGKGSWDSRR